MRTPRAARTRAAAAALLLLLASSLLSSPSPAAAQQDRIIVECDDDDAAACAAPGTDRVCYRYEETGEHACGPCRNGFIEHEEICYDIDDIPTERFVVLAALLEMYLPEFVDPDVDNMERALRLESAARIISYWQSRVPPARFDLGIGSETFLTPEERRGRLGVDPGLTFDPEREGSRGRFERFEYNPPSAAAGGRRRGAEELPPAVDWDAGGYTTPHKNQGVCGCCWAVSTAAAVESALMIRYKDRRMGESLSFQQMISCDEEALGCKGGNILQATHYVWEHDDFGNGNFGGLYSFADWPYTDRRGRATATCGAKSMVDSGRKPAAYLHFPKVVNGVNDFAKFEERRQRLMAAVAQQPVISVLRSGCDLLPNYRGGILTHDQGCECCEVSCIDHAIVIVGYDTTGPTPHWILRNSWGSEWGEGGNFRIAMNDPGCGWGLFGMLAEAAFPADAYRTLEELPERPTWWERAATWEKVMVVLFGVLGACFLCGCLGGLWGRLRSRGRED